MNVSTVRIVLDLNDLELAQFRRVIDEAPRVALNGCFIAKALNALAPYVSLDDVQRLNKWEKECLPPELISSRI